MAKKYFLPREIAKLRAFLLNFKNLISTHGATVGVSVPEIAALQLICTDVIALIDAIYVAKAAQKAAVDSLGTARTEKIPDLAGAIVRVKNHAAYTPTIGDALGIEGEEETNDSSALVGNVKIELDANRPKIVWKKQFADAIDIYVDRASEGNFIFLARDTEPDYVDTLVPAHNNPLTWSYKCIYVISDEQVGQFGAPVSITFKKQTA